MPNPTPEALVAKWREDAARLDRSFDLGHAILASNRRAHADELEAALAASKAEAAGDGLGAGGRYWRERAEFWRSQAVALGWRQERDAANGEIEAAGKVWQGDWASRLLAEEKGYDGRLARHPAPAEPAGGEAVDLEARARELLACQYESDGSQTSAAYVRRGGPISRTVIRAIVAALSAPAVAVGAAHPMSQEDVERWIGACNHEPARQVLRDYLRLRSLEPAAGAVPDVEALRHRVRQIHSTVSLGYQTGPYAYAGEDFAQYLREAKAHCDEILQMLAAATQEAGRG